MTEQNVTMKKCQVCEEVKPLTDFYTHRFSRDGHLHLCKACKLKQGKQYKMHPKNIVIEPGEKLAVEKLRSVGIYATSGKASEWKRIDVVCWSCVRLEVKASLKDENGDYAFNFSNQYQHGMHADLILLICLNEHENTFHLFKASHPVFFRKGRKRGASTGVTGRKAGVQYSPGRTNFKNTYGVSMTDSYMKAHQDNWGLIEETRQRIIQELLDGTYDPDKLVNMDEETQQLRLIS